MCWRGCGQQKGVVHIHTVDVRFSRLEPCAMLMLLSGKKTAHGTLWTPTTTSTSRTLNVARAAVKGQEGESLETLRNIHYLLVKTICIAFLITLGLSIRNIFYGEVQIVARDLLEYLHPFCLPSTCQKHRHGMPALWFKDVQGIAPMQIEDPCWRPCGQFCF